MTLNIGINGLGRIGRLAAQMATAHPDLERVGAPDVSRVDRMRSGAQPDGQR